MGAYLPALEFITVFILELDFIKLILFKFIKFFFGLKEDIGGIFLSVLLSSYENEELCSEFREF